MQTDTQTYSLPIVNNTVAPEQTPSLIDTQNTSTSNNPFTLPLPMAQSTLTEDNSISTEKEKSPINEEKNI